MTAAVALPLRIGARTIGTLTRRLVRVATPLAEAQAGGAPILPALGAADGYLVTGLAAAGLDALGAAPLRQFVRQRYRRGFAALDIGYDAYLAGFSAKSRSTLNRKRRRWAERSGGSLDLRCYRTADEAEEFHRLARTVSARSYQERLLGAGLPAGADALAGMRALAAAGAMRGWLLFLDGRPVSYLYAPAEGQTLIYAHLGYDPDFADLSPGTVLQFEAMRQLMEEGVFRRFDFTAGEGQHKSLFATGTVECIDLLLLRPTLANLAVGHALAAFDASVALAKRLVSRCGLDSLARRIRR